MVVNRVLCSLKNACLGLKYCFITQRNMVIHAMVGVFVIVAAAFLRVSLNGMLFLLAAVVLVLVAEAFNTALEKAIDLHSKERSRPAQVAKDVAAGAVLLTSVFAVVVGLSILGPPLLAALARLFAWR